MGEASRSAKFSESLSQSLGIAFSAKSNFVSGKMVHALLENIFLSAPIRNEGNRMLALQPLVLSLALTKSVRNSAKPEVP